MYTDSCPTLHYNQDDTACTIKVDTNYDNSVTIWAFTRMLRALTAKRPVSLHV